jgi:hypothetical protein
MPTSGIKRRRTCPGYDTADFDEVFHVNAKSAYIGTTEVERLRSDAGLVTTGAPA